MSNLNKYKQNSSSVPEIFAIKVWSRPTLGQILHVFGQRPFEILDLDYKIEHTSEHHAKFCGDQLTELGDLARKKRK